MEKKRAAYFKREEVHCKIVSGNIGEVMCFLAGKSSQQD